VLNRENENWLSVVIEKDEREKEYKMIIDDLERNLEEKKYAYDNLVEKFNLRLDPTKRKQIFGEMGMKLIQSTIKPQNNALAEGDTQNKNNPAWSNIFKEEFDSTNKKTYIDNNEEDIPRTDDQNTVVFKRNSNRLIRRTKKGATIYAKIDKNPEIGIDNVFDSEIKIRSTNNIRNLEGIQESNNAQCVPTENEIKLENPIISPNNAVSTINRNVRRRTIRKSTKKSVEDLQVAGENKINLNLDLTMKNLVRIRNTRNALAVKSLKNKISNKAIFEQRKFNIIDNTILNLDNQLKNYVNKGIKNQINLKDNFAQTDIQAADSEPIAQGNLLKDFESQSNLIFLHIEKLKNSRLNLNSDKAIEADLFKLKDNYNNLLGNYNSLSENYDLSSRHNEFLRDELEKEKEKTEFIVETHREIILLLANCLVDANEKIFDFFENSKENEYSQQVKEIFLKILSNNEEIFKNEKFTPFYEFMSKFKIKCVSDLKFNKNSRNSLIENYSPVISSKNAANAYSSNKKIQISYKNVYRETYSEFKSRNTKIKVNLSQRKILKIINTVYFELLEKIYFRKEHNIELSRENDYVEFPEVLCFYFIQNFGLESLAKKKFLEFLQAVENNEFISKRISLFKKLIAIDDSTVNKTYFDNLITRQILTLIIKLKNNKCIMKTPDEVNLQLLLITNRIIEILLANVTNKEAISNIKQNMGNFIETNKKIFTKHMTSYTVIDFDEFFDSVIEVFYDMRNNFTSVMKSIFSSLDVRNILYYHL